MNRDHPTRGRLLIRTSDRRLNPSGLDAVADMLGVDTSALRTALEAHPEALDELLQRPAAEAPLSRDEALRKRHRRAGIPEVVTEATLQDLDLTNRRGLTSTRLQG
jgi:hypothetical protein